MSPVRTPAAKRSRQEKAAHTASFEVGLLAWRGSWCIWNRCPRALRVRDKAVILPAALRAPSRYFIKPQAASSVSSRSSNRRQLLRSAVVLRTAGSFAVSSRSATGSAACAERTTPNAGDSPRASVRGWTVSAATRNRRPGDQRHVRNSRLFSAPRRGEADGPPRTGEPAGGPADPSGEQAVRGGKNDCLVTNAEWARAPIPDAPLSPPSQETHFKAGGVSRFLLPTSLCGRCTDRRHG